MKNESIGAPERISDDQAEARRCLARVYCLLLDIAGQRRSAGQTEVSQATPEPAANRINPDREDAVTGQCYAE